MNPQEAQLDYPFGDALPDPGRKREIAPGIYWIRKPLPFALDHINLWLLRDRFDGLFRAVLLPPTTADNAIARIEAALVDPEIETVEGLTKATGLHVRQVERLALRAFGFPPKLLLRRARFLRSLHAIRATGRGGGSRAIDPAYTDHSHFIRDAHDFLGMSPQAFLEIDMPLLKDSLKLRTSKTFTSLLSCLTI